MGNLNDVYNNTSIALISKSPNASRVDHFRPIALSNIFFKIITKTMANRLRPHLETLIHTCQSTFIPNRSITNNIIVNHEIMHYLKGEKGGRDTWQSRLILPRFMTKLSEMFFTLLCRILILMMSSSNLFSVVLLHLTS